MNRSKCEWFNTSIKLLGHIVSEKGISMDPEKIKAITEMPYSTNVKEVQQFLGMCGYYRKFVKDFVIRRESKNSNSVITVRKLLILLNKV